MNDIAAAYSVSDTDISKLYLRSANPLELESFLEYWHSEKLLGTLHTFYDEEFANTRYIEDYERINS